MSEQLIAYESFPPGETIQDELVAREWTITELAHRSGLSEEVINKLISTELPVTLEVARGLHQAFGLSVVFWQRHEADWQAYLSRKKKNQQPLEQNVRRSRPPVAPA